MLHIRSEDQADFLQSHMLLADAVTCSLLMQAPGRAPNVSVWFTLVGVIFSFFSTFLAHGFRRCGPVRW